MIIPEILQKVIDELNKLPSIGRKTAQRLALHILKSDKDEVEKLAQALIDRGFTIVSGGTDNHSMLVDLRSKYPTLTGKVAEKALVSADITVNKNMLQDKKKYFIDLLSLKDYFIMQAAYAGPVLLPWICVMLPAVVMMDFGNWDYKPGTWRRVVLF